MTTPDIEQPAAGRATSMVTEAELARRLGVSVRTLQRYRVAGTGPEWSRLGGERGRGIRYTEHDITAWLRARKESAGKS